MKNTLEETKKILLQHVDETEIYIVGFILMEKKKIAFQ